MLTTHYFLSMKEVEVFVSWDHLPLLYVCQDPNNQKYLGIQVNCNSDSLPMEELWLYVAISDERYKEIRNNEVTLYAAIKNSEDWMVYWVIVSESDIPVAHINTELIHEDLMPILGITATDQE